MNPFLNNIPSMEVEELKFDDISLESIKSNFSKLKEAAPSLMNEARHALKFSVNDFTGFGEKLKNSNIEVFELDKKSMKPKL